MSEILAVRGDLPEVAVLERAAGVLRAGELLIYPTETQYALGCLARNAAAVRLLRAAKGRQEVKPLPVIVGSITQARAQVADWPDAAERLARRFWPGPLTLVLPAAPDLPAELTAGTRSLALRVSGLRLASELSLAVGPLVATSANRAGETAPVRCSDAVSRLAHAVRLALDGGTGRPLASTVIDLCGPSPRLLRAGPIDWDDLERVLEGWVRGGLIE